HDLPPPPFWPHGQVAPQALPRRLSPPLAAFKWWIHKDQLGRTHHPLSRLGAGELKFVIDAAASFAELEWAQHRINQPLVQLPAVYRMVTYRQERVAANQAVWGAPAYTLPAILAAGGICADQAYFATQV